MQSYDYSHRTGIDEISWERFDSLVRVLAERLTGIEAVVGIARAGLFPATAVACMLRRELYPVRVTRRVNDEVTFDSPVWKVPLSSEVQGKKIAVIDEITDTGETLALVAEQARTNGAKQVITASLVSHSWANPMPDHVALVSDALVIFPWDRQVYLEGRWQTHPELVEALKLQGKHE